MSAKLRSAFALGTFENFGGEIGMKPSTDGMEERLDSDEAPSVRAEEFTPEHSLPHAFSVIANRISHALERMYGELFGISVVDWRIIAILGTHFPLSAKALAELTAMDQVSVSRAIEQLSNKKLVERRVDSADRRRVALRLSRKGMDIYNRVMPLLSASEALLISELSESDAATIRRIMKTLLERSGRIFASDADWRAIYEDDGKVI